MRAYLEKLMHHIEFYHDNIRMIYLLAIKKLEFVQIEDLCARALARA